MRQLLTSTQSQELANDISKWIKDYADNNSIKSLVIGIKSFDKYIIVKNSLS